MTRYTFFADFFSDRDHEELHQFMMRCLEKAGAQINHTEMHTKKSTGRPSINRPIIEDYIKTAGNKVGMKFTLEEVAEATGLPDSAVGKWFRRLASEGILTRQYKIGVPADWELVKALD